MLTDLEIKRAINEIISGQKLYHSCITDYTYLFQMPTMTNRQKAELIYDAALIRAAQQEIPTQKQMERLMQNEGIISTRDYERLQKAEDRIKTLKLMRSRTRSHKQIGELELQINIVENTINNIHAKHARYFNLTAESKAEQEKTIYLIHLGIMELDESPIWKSVEEFKRDQRQDLQAELIREYLAFARGFETKTLRAIARNREWRIYWKSATKTHTPLFDGAVTSWDINKLLLTYWSDFYEAIINHPNAPDENIINNDVMCDQWLEDQSRQIISQGQGDITKVSQGGKDKMTINVNENYRLVTQKDWDAEEVERQKIAKRK